MAQGSSPVICRLRSAALALPAGFGFPRQRKGAGTPAARRPFLIAAGIFARTGTGCSCSARRPNAAGAKRKLQPEHIAATCIDIVRVLN